MKLGWTLVIWLSVAPRLVQSFFILNSMAFSQRILAATPRMPNVASLIVTLVGIHLAELRRAEVVIVAELGELSTRRALRPFDRIGRRLAQPGKRQQQDEDHHQVDDFAEERTARTHRPPLCCEAAAMLRSRKRLQPLIPNP